MPFELPSQPAPDLPSRWCLFDGDLLWLLDQQLPEQAPANAQFTRPSFLGVHEQRNLFMAELIGAAPADGEWLPLRPALMALPANQIQAAARAAQLRQFFHSHRFCGHCATPLELARDQLGRRCPSCGQLYYPRISPAMMVLVQRGRELLLARSPHFAPGVYSALAGFVEPGETLEECVHRETWEEAGIRIKNLRYAFSQSWPFPHSLMLAFTAEYDGGALTPQEGEIEDAQWFDIDALPGLPSTISIARHLIEFTCNQINNKNG
ncbi:NAD(+) diphosphatase [Chromobacterium sp. IIBBL 290-4]|uniref:NAD(+) diphosphatase n=1 Tax=Chromobacterium sp. IIBBL 290-4 TaxID=2953890 RepID=UPI0020B757A7|nr:NAD(+) diphosphatase [Chromobacterium sp. IIBBL 290-4]UTH73607.1 NAD(+) diphosphatase [Chromobacterium sp. IIBBL 290-4]